MSYINKRYLTNSKPKFKIRNRKTKEELKQKNKKDLNNKREIEKKQVCYIQV